MVVAVDTGAAESGRQGVGGQSIYVNALGALRFAARPRPAADRRNVPPTRRPTRHYVVPTIRPRAPARAHAWAPLLKQISTKKDLYSCPILTPKTFPLPLCRKASRFKREIPVDRPARKTKRPNFLKPSARRISKAIITAMVTKAKDGDVKAAELILSRLAPIPRGRKVAFAWPAGLDTKQISVAFDAVLVAVGQGMLTPDEAVQIGSLLEKRARVIDTDQIQAEIAELRAMIEKLQGARQ